MRSYFLLLAACGAGAFIASAPSVMRPIAAAFAAPEQSAFVPASAQTIIWQHEPMPSAPLSCGIMAQTQDAQGPCRTAQNTQATALPQPATRPPSTRTVIKVGDQVQPDNLHQITRPGLYGLGLPPEGHSYGVIDSKLVRYNFTTNQVLSVIRTVDHIFD